MKVSSVIEPPAASRQPPAIDRALWARCSGSHCQLPTANCQLARPSLYPSFRTGGTGGAPSGSSACGDGGGSGAGGGSANGLSYGSTFGWADCAILLSSLSVSENPCCTESRIERAESSMLDWSFFSSSSSISREISALTSLT